MNNTKYERARIIGARALQLSMGAPMMIKLSQVDLQRIKYSTVEIAKMEYEQGLVPISVKRGEKDVGCLFSEWDDSGFSAESKGSAKTG